MNARKSSIHVFFFLVSWVLFLTTPVLLLPAMVYPFAPFLALTFQRNQFRTSLLLGSFCGLCTDLFTTSTPFGLFALVYALTTVAIYPLCSYLFEEKVFTLPLYTLLISLMLSLLLTPLFLWKNTLSLLSLATLFIFTPLITSLFSLFCFSLPIYIKRRLYAY